MPVAAFAVATAIGSALVASRLAKGHRAGLTVSRHDIPWRRGVRRTRVVHLTDIHVGVTTPVRVLTRVAEVVHDLEPDLVVMTGDYVNASLYHVDRVTGLVRDLPRPCVATLGNHDHWTSAARVTRALEAGGAHVLCNESMTFDSLTVVGVDDGRSGHADVRRAFASVEDPEHALVLSHFPNTAEEIAGTGAPLVLSGHTHAGHVDVRHATDALARLAGNPYLHGFHRVGERTDVYVSAGIGHSLPGLRAGRACPEIAVFDLDPQATRRRSHAERAPLR